MISSVGSTQPKGSMKLFVTFAALVVAFTVGAAEHTTVQSFTVDVTQLPFTQTLHVDQFKLPNKTLTRVQISSNWIITSEGFYDASAQLIGSGVTCEPDCVDNHWIDDGENQWGLGIGLDEDDPGLAQYIGNGEVQLEVRFMLNSSTAPVYGSVELEVTYFWEN